MITIRLICSEGHFQHVVVNPAKTGSSIVSGFLKRMDKDLAALLDGSSKLYEVPPTPRRCHTEGCDRIVRAEVVK